MVEARLRGPAHAGLWLLLLLSTSCASGPPPGPSPAELAGRSAQRIVLSPFNIVTAMPPELEGSTDIVWDALLAHLEAHGKKVEVMRYDAARDLWLASMREVREQGLSRNFDNAARLYASGVAEHLEFDAIVFPSLAVRNAKARAGKARWDDAEQRIEIRGNLEGAMFQGQRRSLDLAAASIRVVVLDREGRSLQAKWQGIELIQHINFRTRAEGGYSSKRTHVWRIEDDVPPIQDADRVQAAIESALSPFLPATPPSTDAP